MILDDGTRKELCIYDKLDERREDEWPSVVVIVHLKRYQRIRVDMSLPPSHQHATVRVH